MNISEAPSRWIQVNIDHDPGIGGTNTDQLLLKVIGPHAEESIADGTAHRFFFLRYFEGESHLRYRLLCPRGVTEADIVHQLHSGLQSAALMGRVQPAVYSPETAKYGGPAGLAVAEDNFHESSIFAIRAIEATATAPGRRVLLYACVLDLLLEGHGLSALQRQDALRRYRSQFATICGRSGQTVPHPSHDDYRGLSQRLVGGAARTLQDLIDCRDWLTECRRNLDDLNVLSSVGRLNISPVSICMNFAHTFANRLGLSAADEVMATTIALGAASHPLINSEPESSVVDLLRARRASVLTTPAGVEGGVENLRSRLGNEIQTWIRARVQHAAGPWQPWPDVLHQLGRDEKATQTEHPLWLNPSCPILIDPLARAEAIRSAIGSPAGITVFQLEGMDSATSDSWEILSYLIRSWRNQPVAFVITGLDTSSHGDFQRLLLSVFDLVPVIQMSGGHAHTERRLFPSTRTSKTHLQGAYGIELAKSGAIRTAIQLLSHSGEGPVNNDEHIYLALSLLRIGDLRRALTTAEEVFNGRPNLNQRVLARRVIIIACRALSLETSVPLDVLGRQAEEDLLHSALGTRSRRWLQLDVAAVAAAANDMSKHDTLLGSVIDEADPEDVQSLIAALLWRGASSAVAGRPAQALPDQMAAMALLREVGDVSRAVQVAIRTAATLGALRRWQDSANLFSSAASDALNGGNYQLAASAAFEAVWALVWSGDAAHAHKIADRYRDIWPLWTGSGEQLGLSLAEACLAWSDNELRTCRGLVASLLPRLREQSKKIENARFGCYAALLLRNCALKLGDQTEAQRWNNVLRKFIGILAAEEIPRMQSFAGD